jgi:hypothetical protein
MLSSGTLCHVALVRTDVSEEHITSIIRVTGIGELGILAATKAHWLFQLIVTANVVPSSPILVTLMMGVIRSSKTAVLTRVTQCIIPEAGILHNSTFNL